jgi:hypothetical protein
MCFDQPTSYGFAAFGLALAIYSNHALKAKGGRAARGADRFSTGVFYFVTMEALQGEHTDARPTRASMRVCSSMRTRRPRPSPSASAPHCCG